jgi:general secretion pathway protein D
VKKRIPALLVQVAVLVGLAGCAPGQKLIETGNAQIAQGDFEGGLAALEQAVKAEPDNYQYRAQLERQRESYINRLLQQGDQYRMAGQFDDAALVFKRILGIDGANPRALAGLEQIAADRRHLGFLERGEAQLKAGKLDEARATVEQVLKEDPASAGALKLRREIEDADPQRGIPMALRPQLRKQVSLEFRDANIKSVFEALSRSTGVNFVFDREIKPDLQVTVFLQNTTVEDAIGVLTVTNQLDKKYLNDNTVLIYPATLAKQKDYQELAVKTFYLANAEAKSIVQMLKAILKTRDVYADEKLNSITVRDTPAAVRLVEKLIAAQDLAEPEVTLEVEVLEVSRTRLTELGVNPPGQFTLLNIVPSPTQTVAANGTVVTNVNDVTTTSQLTLSNLKHFNSGDIGIPNPQVNLQAQLGDTNLLANPKIRVKNKEKAHILIGDKVPVITTTATANVGVSQSVSYLDVGLKLDVQPVVYLNNEVSISVGLEVSSITKEITTQSGGLTYQIGTRSATTSLRLRDGETQILAGLINDQERHSAQGIPGLIDIPIANRLFSSGTDQHDKTEIVLLITPHVVRNIVYNPDAVLEYTAGTDASTGATPLLLRPTASMSAPPLGSVPGVQGRRRGSEPGAAEPATIPEPVPAPPPEPPPATPTPEGSDPNAGRARGNPASSSGPGSGATGNPLPAAVPAALVPYNSAPSGSTEPAAGAGERSGEPAGQ